MNGLSMNKAKIENSFLTEKINLRLDILPKKQVNVLDCFYGEGLIWSIIGKKHKSKINVISIDKNINSNANFIGDNCKYLKNLDLSQFDIIDLDSYGIPFPQLEIIFQSKKIDCIIFYTHICTFMGGLHRKMLYKLGYTKKMIDKCPTLFYRNGFDKFKSYLWLNGIREIWNINYNKKNYGYFILKK
jgi:hypothetical protein